MKTFLVSVLAIVVCLTMVPGKAKSDQYAVVGPWDIASYAKTSTCLASKILSNGNYMGITANRNAGFEFGFANERWKSIEENKYYNIEISFGRGYDSWRTVAVGGNSILHVKIDDTKMVLQFMKRNNLSLHFNGSVIAEFSLHKSYAATLKLLECVDSLVGGAPPGAPRDPFAADGSGARRDPFAQ